jgi:transposase
MTLHPIEQWTIPAETVRVAQAAFPKGNVYMTIYERLGQLYFDENFQDLYPARCGQSAISPARLALITIMQFAEGLSDRQAAEAIRSRIDWKYLLGLELTDSGFDSTVICEFRKRLISQGQERQLLDLMLKKLKEEKLVKSRGQQRTDATHVLAAIRKVNRLENVGETLRHALNDLATVAPQWLKARVSADWFDRYGVRFEQYRLCQNQDEAEQLALVIGKDGHQILSAIWDELGMKWLRQIESVEILRQVWVQQYAYVEGKLVWRDSKTTGKPAHRNLIVSPYDPEARNSTKRHTNWTGYKVHLTETCSENQPHLITNVETTPATTDDGALTQQIHLSLAQKNLLPRQHFLDTAYVDAEHLVTSQQVHQVELVGPVLADNSWQARLPEGNDLSCFAIDWEKKQVRCPQAHFNRSWQEKKDDLGNSIVEVRFDSKTCASCPQRQLCTRSVKAPRVLKLKPQAQFEALQSARLHQTTNEFRQDYSQRAGVEGTISQGIRAFGLRRSRYLGLAKTHLQHIATAAAINLSRLMDWFSDNLSEKTRTSRFAALAS